MAERSRGRKKKREKPARRRNPFAGRRRTGAGPHTEAKYSKRDRRRLKKEAEAERKQSEEES